MPVRAAMKDASDGRMRLTVLGGFLGSGKTTWLRHQLHHGLLADAFVVVNEVAETAVDDALLGRSPELAVLVGGCACCDALGDLITLLRAICDARVSRAQGAAPLDQIVLETSGLADPGPIVAALRADPILIHHLVVCEIVVVVDAVYGMRQIRQEPLCRRQMELADRVIVTKIDEAEADHLASLLSTLRRINPAATICGAVKGSEAMLPPYEGVAAETLPDLGGAPAGLPILALNLTIGDDIDWTAFSVWLSALIHARGDDILRVKGVVRTPAGRLLLQSVRKIVQSPEILPNEDDRRIGEENSVIFIGRGFSKENLSRSLRHFAEIRSEGHDALSKFRRCTPKPGEPDAC